jgi:ParB family chromosome partitioning protein
MGLIDALPHGPQRVALIAASNLDSSITDEWYTPSEIIEKAREAMGSIDTDPASCAKANETVGARHFYTREVSGLIENHRWQGNVWLNPPYGRGDASARGFINRLIIERGKGNVAQAITCLNSRSSHSLWFEPVWAHASVHLMYRGRIKFIGTDPERGASSPTICSILSYFGDNPQRFAEVFRPFGNIVVKYE